MPSTPRQTLARIGYFARNVALDVAPKGIFEGRRAEILRGAGEFDEAYLRDRVRYYNKLEGAISLGGETLTTISNVPRDRTFYYFDFMEHARYFPAHLEVCTFFGDKQISPDVPSFAKSRPIEGDNRNSVLLNLNRFRHFQFHPDARAFQDKLSKVVWRGGPHNPSRRQLLDGYRNHPLCDVGSPVVDRSSPDYKPFLGPAEQMAFKYIISVEGVDVATNLKWILASNSLCIMPRPRYETWFMEGRLEAEKHYVQVMEDFSDLEEKISYYERRPDEALSIVAAANSFAAQFRNARREQIISLMVMEKYFASAALCRD